MGKPEVGYPLAGSVPLTSYLCSGRSIPLPGAHPLPPPRHLSNRWRHHQSAAFRAPFGTNHQLIKASSGIILSADFTSQGPSVIVADYQCQRIHVYYHHHWSLWMYQLYFACTVYQGSGSADTFGFGLFRWIRIRKIFTESRVGTGKYPGIVKLFKGTVAWDFLVWVFFMNG